MLLVGVVVLFLLSWFSTDVVCFFSFILYTLWCKKGHFLEGPYAWISFFVLIGYYVTAAVTRKVRGKK